MDISRGVVGGSAVVVIECKASLLPERRDVAPATGSATPQLGKWFQS